MKGSLGREVRKKNDDSHRRETEYVLSDIAEVLDIRLESPVPLVFQQQRMLVEESGSNVSDDGPLPTDRGLILPGVESAHVVITLQSSIHDRLITLLSNAFLGDFLVHPVGETPHAAVDLPKLHGSTGVVDDRILELLVEVSVVQEHIRVVPPSVEVSLDRLERLNDTLKFLIPRKDDESRVGSGTRRVDVQATGSEDLIMLLTDFSVHGVHLR